MTISDTHSFECTSAFGSEEGQLIQMQGIRFPVGH